MTGTRTLCSAAAIALFVVSTSAGTVNVTFSEVPGLNPSGELLDGTGDFASLGLEFSDGTYRVADTDFAGANDPTYVGITTFEDGVMTVNLLTAASSVTFDWIAYAASGLDAVAYDASGNELDSFSITSAGAFQSGSATLLGGVIDRITFAGAGARQIGVGFISYNTVIVPAPLAAGAAVLGLLPVASRRSRGF